LQFRTIFGSYVGRYVTARVTVLASIHPRRTTAETPTVCSGAERFKTLVDGHGPDEALRIIELDEIASTSRRSPSGLPPISTT
jgi:hypothetical protein